MIERLSITKVQWLAMDYIARSGQNDATAKYYLKLRLVPPNSLGLPSVYRSNSKWQFQRELVLVKT
jgi:hypothetical protein